MNAPLPAHVAKSAARGHENGTGTRTAGCCPKCGQPMSEDGATVLPAPPLVLCILDLEIDLAEHRVKRGGRTIHLTPREFALLRLLAGRRGKVVSRSTIWEALYDECDANSSNVIDVYIRYLRKKIDDHFEPRLILTCWGQGYMLRSEADPSPPI